MDRLVSAASRIAHRGYNLVAGPRLSILIYHRVHARADTVFPDEQDAVRFERLMRFVARSFTVMTLSRAVSALQRGDLPPRALVVTFDDGYADNAEVALPILQRCGLAATFFVSTGFLDGGRMWNDSVIEIVRACRHGAIDLEDFGFGRCSLAGLAERRAVIGRLLPHIKYLQVGEREDAIARLHKLSGLAELPDHLMMRSEQVRQLHQAGMEIGAHTVQHPILTTLAPTEAEHEITAGRNRLQEIIDAPVDVFAYPNGKPERDYDHSHVELLRRLGFAAAVSTAPGVARIGDDFLQLPRFTPWGPALVTWATRLLVHQTSTSYEVAVAPRG
ncbi:MAG: polysaccharide deacetylase family protein [Candidatus Accumulibacter necessarius]|uniref:polysaccharide deacetylase family protein n=1 Tax=Candidatus Accumulibacter necessarius TaxID=2954386 RepID=UPI002FC2CD00